MHALFSGSGSPVLLVSGEVGRLQQQQPVVRTDAARTHEYMCVCVCMREEERQVVGITGRSAD